MLKRTLTKAQFDALSPEIRALYIADGDNYKLNAETDGEDVGALRRAHDREKQEAKDAKKKAADLQAELDSLKIDPARKAGDIATLEKAWSDKLTAKEAELNGKLAAANQHISRIMIDHASTQIASAITAKPEHASLMLPHITPRLEVVFDGDKPTVKIKDKEGKLSAMNLEDLQKELVANPTYSTVVVVSKASGAGGSGGGRSGSGGGAPGTTKFSDFSEAERTQLYRDNPTEFKRLSDEAKQERFAKRA